MENILTHIDAGVEKAEQLVESLYQLVKETLEVFNLGHIAVKKHPDGLLFSEFTVGIKKADAVLQLTNGGLNEEVATKIINAVATYLKDGVRILKDGANMLQGGVKVLTEGRQIIDDVKSLLATKPQ